MSDHSRLPRTFHQTFKPERQYIHELLEYAAKGLEYDLKNIAKATNIPMGVSSGKVPAILKYCLGMGLIQLKTESTNPKIKKIELTSFGRVVFLEDPYLKCSITQWLCHFHLCRPSGGAEVWHLTFFKGTPILGFSFERETLNSYLRMECGVNKGNLIGPLIGMYEDEASFRKCGALSQWNGTITRKQAPLTDEHARGYGAWLIELINEHFPNQRQVPLDELNKTGGILSLTGWNDVSLITVLSLLERKKIITVDRHMTPWLIQPINSLTEAWKNIYLDIF